MFFISYRDRFGDHCPALKLGWTIVLVCLTFVGIVFGIVGVCIYKDQISKIVELNKLRETDDLEIRDLKLQKETLMKTAAILTVNYENLQCSSRSLVVTKVKGITLCMDAQTKALHRIDDKED